MKPTVIATLSVGLALVAASTASAQLTAAKDGPVVYGHHHLNVTSIADHKKFWVDTLGGKVFPFARAEGVKFPNLIILFRQQAPTGGTKGTTVNHFGFQVPNVRAVVDRLKAAGYPIVTKDETTNPEKDGVAFVASLNQSIAFVMGPDNTKVEFVENSGATMPIALHHIHFFTQDANGMRDWYANTFGAKPGKRGTFEAADLPGVNLTFGSSPDPVVGTQGRSIDHIGFEVRDLAGFCKKLEGMGIKLERPYTKLPDPNIAIAFIKDPWGTYIELTEGLDKF